MKRGVLIDSLYINHGGGLHLLHYLIDKLQEKDIEFFLLADKRCIGDFGNVKDKLFLPASLRERKRFYKKNRESFDCIVCFANLPPQIRITVPVFTYFHNINLLTLQESSGIRSWVTQYLKRLFFRSYKNNTDYWVVQTDNTSNELQLHLRENMSRILVMPFFDLPSALEELAIHVPKEHRCDYVFVGDYYGGAKGHNELLDAWEILHARGVKPNLHLTIDVSHREVCHRIDNLKKKGVSIINHGTIPFGDVIKLYSMSKATIYPSHNESLGLGIIEAVTAGCDVIGANLPYLHSICFPSGVFDPYSSLSIADAVYEYENNMADPSKLKISNHIDDFINLVVHH